MGDKRLGPLSVLSPQSSVLRIDRSPAMNEWLAARNILAIRPDNVGDVIMLGPALRAIKETSPGGRLTLLASTGGATAAALLPWVDEVLPWRTLWQDLGH